MFPSCKITHQTPTVQHPHKTDTYLRSRNTAINSFTPQSLQLYVFLGCFFVCFFKDFIQNVSVFTSMHLCFIQYKVVLLAWARFIWSWRKCRAHISQVATPFRSNNSYSHLGAIKPPISNLT